MTMTHACLNMVDLPPMFGPVRSSTEGTCFRQDLFYKRVLWQRHICIRTLPPKTRLFGIKSDSSSKLLATHGWRPLRNRRTGFSLTPSPFDTNVGLDMTSLAWRLRCARERIQSSCWTTLVTRVQSSTFWENLLNRLHMLLWSASSRRASAFSILWNSSKISGLQYLRYPFFLDFKSQSSGTRVFSGISNW